LEQQNKDMRMRLQEFNEDQKENWASFREKFKHDMKQFGTAMKDFWGGKK